MDRYIDLMAKMGYNYWTKRSFLLSCFLFPLSLILFGLFDSSFLHSFSLSMITIGQRGRLCVKIVDSEATHLTI